MMNKNVIARILELNNVTEIDGSQIKITRDTDNREFIATIDNTLGTDNISVSLINTITYDKVEVTSVVADEEVIQIRLKDINDLKTSMVWVMNLDRCDSSTTNNVLDKEVEKLKETNTLLIEKYDELSRVTDEKIKALELYMAEASNNRNNNNNSHQRTKNDNIPRVDLKSQK